jgi:hypothetical protein
MCFEMLLYTGKFFTDLFPPTFGSFQFRPCPALHLASLHFLTVSVTANKQTVKGMVMLKVLNEMKHKPFLLKSCPCFLFPCKKISIYLNCHYNVSYTFDKLCILTIDRSPRGDFTNFLNRLDLILQKLYNNKYIIIICGDINVNYLIDYNQRSQLNAVLHSYNLAGIVEFPTTFSLNSQTAIDNVFIDTSTIGKYDLYPFINGLSDHDAQLLILNTGQKKEKECHTYTKRKINKYAIANFQLKLRHETWETVFDRNDVNKIFNSFLTIFFKNLLF